MTNPERIKMKTKPTTIIDILDQMAYNLEWIFPDIKGSPRIAQSKTMMGKMPKNIMIPGKYGNIMRGYYDINGKSMFFRSKWEANYALYLDFLIKAKQIDRQVKR